LCGDRKRSFFRSWFGLARERFYLRLITLRLAALVAKTGVFR
jgi:hypothetical protein